MSAPPTRPGALRRLIVLHRPHAGALALAAGLMAVAAAVPGALVLLIQQVLDGLLDARDPRALGALPVLVVALYGVNGGVGLARAALTRRVSLEVSAGLRQQLFEHMLRLPLSWHQGRPLGERLSLLTQDVGQVQYLVSAWATLVQKPLTLLALLAAAWRMDPGLTGLALLVLPPVAWVIHRFGRRLRLAARQSLEGLGALTTEAQQSLAGLRVVRAFGAEAQRARSFAARNRAQEELQLRATLAQLLPGPVIEALAAVGVALVIRVGGARVFAGELSAGELVGFLVAIGLLNLPLKGLSELHSLTQRAVAAGERVFAVLDEAPADEGELGLPPGPVEVELAGVTLDYGDGPVLRGVDLRLRPGQTLALVGPSGAGKSSIAALLLRQRDPSAGAVRFNGVDLRQLRRDSLRQAVAVVPQEPFLFGATVLENLRIGRPDASVEQVQAALEAARAADFVRALPQGLDTPVGEEGARLSGGQRQRLCIARALLADTPVLVLDEATSALDPQSEAEVAAGLDALRTGRTTLLIAHRPATARRADQVVVIEDGRVVAEGPPALLDRLGWPEGGERGIEEPP